VLNILYTSVMFSHTIIKYDVGMKLFWQQAVQVTNIIINKIFFLPFEIRYIKTLPSFEQTADALGLVVSLIFILTDNLWTQYIILQRNANITDA
jgi:hypothetical protein